MVIHISKKSNPLSYASQIKHFADNFGFDEKKLAEIGITVCELVSNVIKFANQGKLIVSHITTPQPGIKIVVQDNGPGFDRIDKVLIDGYSEGRMLCEDRYVSSRKSLGCGLGAVKRLMSSLHLENNPDGGASVIVEKYL